MRTIIRTLGWMAMLSFLAACGNNQLARFEGRTMGTTYHIKVVASIFQHTDHLKKKIEQRLDEINRSMSVYKPDSEISRLNKNVKPEKPICISNDFYHVLTMC